VCLSALGHHMVETCQRSPLPFCEAQKLDISRKNVRRSKDGAYGRRRHIYV
jgi:hypothetical protein